MASSPKTSHLLFKGDFWPLALVTLVFYAIVQLKAEGADLEKALEMVGNPGTSDLCTSG